jgi:hypothetical protein
VTFQLEQSVDGWCKAIGASGSDPDTLTELKDHLYCAIERLREQGLSDQEAFLAVTKQMGDVETLAVEFSRNDGYRARLCSRAKGISSATPPNRSERMSSIKLASVTVVQSLVWAALMILVSATLSGTDQKTQVFNYLLAGWFISSSLPLVLVDYRKAMRDECAFLGRVFHFRKV